jgi:hypothetical protein
MNIIKINKIIIITNILETLFLILSPPCQLGPGRRFGLASLLALGHSPVVGVAVVPPSVGQMRTNCRPAIPRALLMLMSLLPPRPGSPMAFAVGMRRRRQLAELCKYALLQ